MVTEKGQSIIEVIFSVAVVVLVITGVIALVVSTVSVKNNGFQRKTASDMANVVVENLINQQKNDTENFWSSTVSTLDTGQTLANYPGYTYAVGYTLDKTDGGCDCGTRNCCANAVVNVSWGNNQILTVNRFFSRGN